MMLDRLRNMILPTKASSLAKAFARLGWAGVWLQVVFGSIPILVMMYYFFFAHAQASRVAAWRLSST